MDQQQVRNMRRLLDRWGHTLWYVQDKEEELAALRRMINAAYDSARSSALSGLPRGGGLPSSAVESAMDSVERCTKGYEDASAILNAEIAQALSLKQAIDEVIRELDARTQKILAMRYADDHQWPYIAMQTHYAERHARRLEVEAIRVLVERIEVE